MIPVAVEVSRRVSSPEYATVCLPGWLAANKEQCLAPGTQSRDSERGTGRV